MAVRKKPERDKAVFLESGLHKKLKLICFDHDIYIHDLVNSLLRIVLSDDQKVIEIVAELDPA